MLFTQHAQNNHINDFYKGEFLLNIESLFKIYFEFYLSTTVDLELSNESLFYCKKVLVKR